MIDDGADIAGYCASCRKTFRVLADGMCRTCNESRVNDDRTITVGGWDTAARIRPLSELKPYHYMNPREAADLPPEERH